jgi:hypothetical protein
MGWLHTFYLLTSVTKDGGTRGGRSHSLLVKLVKVIKDEQFCIIPSVYVIVHYLK